MFGKKEADEERETDRGILSGSTQTSRQLNKNQLRVQNKECTSKNIQIHRAETDGKTRIIKSSTTEIQKLETNQSFFFYF